MSERYGLPYMGSKNDIASWICNRLTHGGTLYDVFAGGCAITHYAMLHKMYDRYVVNDVNPICQLFKDAVDGKYKNETEWISREKFEQRKKDDMYVRQCWSFGNKGNTYLYSYLKEPWKKALHYLYLLHDDSLMKDMGIEIPRECISDKSLCRRWIISHENYCRNKYVALLSVSQVLFSIYCFDNHLANSSLLYFLPNFST